MNIIQTRNLTKSYGDFTAVSNLNLHVPKGSVYGFVGGSPVQAAEHLSSIK